MKTVTKKTYEGMFLVDTALAASDWNDVLGAIETVLKRADAEVISLRKWDERRMEYAIKGVSRGTYILTYFRCEGPRISGIERDVQLSEKIMRVLILQAENLTQEDMEKDTPAIEAEKAAEAEEKAKEKAAAEAAAKAEAAGAPAESAVEAKAEEAPAAESDEAPAAAETPAQTEAKDAESTEEAPAPEAEASPEAPAAPEADEQTKSE